MKCAVRVKNTFRHALRALAAVLGLLALLLAPGTAAPVHAEGTVTTTKAILNDITTVDSGVEFTYLINYQFASTTENGAGVKLVDVLDADLSKTSAQVIIGTTSHVASTAYNSTTGTVTWNFIDPLPAGSSGQLTLKVRFPLGATLPATVAVNTATMSATNAPSATSNAVSITANASCKWATNVTGPTTAVIGQNVTYRARLDRPNPATGNLNATSGSLALTLPVGVLPADVVNANGGTISGTGTAGNPVVVTWTGVTGAANGNAGSEAFGRDLIIKYDAARFTSGQAVTVSEQMNVTVLGGTSCGGTDSQGTTLSNFTPTPNGTATKGRSDADVFLGQSFYYTLDADSTGNVGLDNYTVSDSLPQNLALSSIQLPTVNNGPGGNFITVKYRRSDDATTLYTWPGGPFAAATTPLLNVSALSLPAGVYVSYVQFEFGTVASNFGINSAIRLNGTLISPGWGTPPQTITAGNQVCNTETFSATYNGSPAFTAKTSQSCVTVILRTVRPTVAKSVFSGSSIIPGQTTTWQVEVSNPGTSDIPMVNPKGMDLLPASLEYVVGSFGRRTDGTFNSAGAPAPTLEVIDNYNNTGRTLLRWLYTGSFPIGTRATVQFQTRVKAGVAASTVNNRGYVSVDPAAQTGPVVYPTSEADANDLNGNGSGTDQRGRTGDVGITVNSSATLDSYKLVKGQLDTDWSKYPDSGRTSPGGTADYRLVVKNTGNISLKNFVLVDILPVVGDTAVTSTTPRLTQWTPFLAGPVSAPSGVTVYYSTEANPQRNEMGDPDPFPAGSSAPNWSAVPPADITTVRSLRFDFGSKVLAPLDQFELSWPMRAPTNAPTSGEIAWNSFGVAATRSDNNLPLLPTEPLKVGIKVEPLKPAAYGSLVWNDTNRDGIQDTGEPGLDGVRVELYRDNGDGTSNPATDELVGFTLTSGGGQYLFSNLPSGNYYAVFFKPPAYSTSPANQESNDEVDSDGVTGAVRGLPATIMPVTTLVTGEYYYMWDQGFYQPASPVAAVGNYVWFDENNNGQQDEAATNGLNGVTVKLYSSAGVLQGTTTTANDANGNPGYYLFDGLAPVSYYIEFTRPDGFTFTTRGATGASDPSDSDPDTTTGRTETFTLSSGQYDPSWDAGMRLPTGALSLGDRVWADANGNGLYDAGELGVDNVKLNLYRDLNGNGVFDPGSDQFFATTTTFTKAGVPGYYLFNNLPAGDFIVQVDPTNFAGGPLTGYSSTAWNGVAPDPDNNTESDDNGEPLTGQGVVSRAITLSAGAEPGTGGNENPTLDFGFVQPAAIGNYVWVDTNGNGVQDTGEAGLEGVTVKLYRPGYGPDGIPGNADDATTVATQQTTGGGAYSFTGLHPGSYYVEVLKPSGYSFTLPDLGGDDAKDSDANPTTGVMATTTLVSGENDLTWDAGLYQPAAISGSVCVGGGDGTCAAGEPLVAGVTVTLIYAGPDGILGTADDVTRTTTTNSSGAYSFTDLAPGLYKVVETNPPNATSVADRDGGDPDNITVSLVGGQNLTGQDFEDQGGADLAVTKTDGLTLVASGQTLVYTVKVTNHGIIPAAGVVLTDKVGANLKYVSDTCGMTGSGSTYTWNVGDLAVGASATCAVTMKVADSLADGMTVTNYVSATTTTAESNVTDNEMADKDTIQAADAPDLQVEKTDGRTQVLAGASLTYDITYKNVGKAGATGVVVTDELPANVTYVSSSPSGTQSGTTLTWNIGDLAANGTGAIQVNVTVNSGLLPGAVVLNRVSISPTAGDRNPADNTISDSDAVVAPYVVIEKSVTGPAYVGGEVTYTIRWQNNSTDTANDVIITDVLPANTTLVAGSITGGGALSGSTITWTLGNKAPGASGTVSFKVTVNTGAGGALKTTPTLSTETGAGSVTVTSKTAAYTSLPWCDAAFNPKCLTYRGFYQGTTSIPQAGWNDNPRATVFAETGWTQPVAATVETGLWMSAGTLNAEWTAMNTTGVTTPNYTFFRQAFCLPLNASNLGASLDLSSDDLSTVYLNGINIGTHTGAGAYSTLSGNGGIQSGINILAVQLLNNTHDGHAIYGGDDHSGLLFNLQASYGSLRPFAYAPSMILAGQTATFTVDENALGGRTPYFYRYDWGDGTLAQDYTSDLKTLTHTYATPGTYVATVTARAQYGCTGADQVTITVLPTGSPEDSKILANAANVAYKNTATTPVSYSGQSGAGIKLDMGTVTGFVYVDEDGNGQYEDGIDSPANGIEVRITDAYGIVHTGYTGASGYYSLAEVGAGSATVDLINPPAGVQTQGTDATSGVLVAAGYTAFEENNGFYNRAAIGNKVWFDRNGDGVQDPGEAGIADVAVQLWNSDRTEVLRTTFTDADGNYRFDRMPAGTYYVEPMTPTGMTQSALYGTDDATNKGAPYSVTVTGGSENITADFGFYQPLTLAGTVWNDTLHRNNTQDVDEPGVANVVVNLYVDANDDGIPDNPTAVGTATTGTGGAYEFTNLAPGNYVVVVMGSNFDANGPLKDASAVAGGADPDADTSNTDSNGIPGVVEKGGVTGLFAPTVTLVSQAEPTGDGVVGPAPLSRDDNGNGTVDFGFFGGTPLAVTLASFTATTAVDGVTLAWETVSETDNAGFNIYRADSEAGPWVRVNATLLPAAAPGSSVGHAYTWTDATAQPNTVYVYRLEAVALDGTIEIMDAIGVTYRPARRTWLPWVSMRR